MFSRITRKFPGRPWGVATVAAAVAILPGSRAQAAYPGGNGAIAYEAFAAQDTEGGPPYSEVDAIAVKSQTISACENNSGPLACTFGAPSYSPDGTMLVVSRHVPTNAFLGAGDEGSLMLVNADGTGARTIARQSADDEDPAFLPSGTGIVFAGRPAGSAGANLFVVGIDGSGLHQLTTAGGTQPAPCESGAIAFVRRGNIYLRRTDGALRRITWRGGAWPSCSPNSRRVAFVRGRVLYTIGTNATNLRRISKRCSYSPTFSPNGRLIACVAAVDLPSSNGGAYELRVLDHRGHQIGQGTDIASYGFSGDSGANYEGSTAGISWQPLPAAGQ